MIRSTLTILLILFCPVFGSWGDKIWIFKNCMGPCIQRYCSPKGQSFGQLPNPPSHWIPNKLGLTPWPCHKECTYSCCWVTVQTLGVYKELPTPRFHGKWPLIRFMGMQEPASAIFSILNCLSSVIGLAWFRKRVPSTAPMYNVWTFFGLTCVNAWFSSTVYHTRDTRTTEIMDYIGAFFMMEAYCFAFVYRMLGPQRRAHLCVIGGGLFVFLIQHSHYMIFVKFNYSYSMKVSFVLGALNALGWVVWSWRCRKARPYVYKCLVTVLSLAALLLLGVKDFAPIYWIFDAHSIWHAGTIPFGFLWFSFAIDDCLYLLEAEHQEKKEQ